jgi:hypothetical protein
MTSPTSLGSDAPGCDTLLGGPGLAVTEIARDHRHSGHVLGEHLGENIAACGVRLSPDDVKALDGLAVA